MRSPKSERKVSGGYIGGVPPVPIPNTEVKPSRADGTARFPCGRVGRCRNFSQNAPPSAVTGRPRGIRLSGFVPLPAHREGAKVIGGKATRSATGGVGPQVQTLRDFAPSRCALRPLACHTRPIG